MNNPSHMIAPAKMFFDAARDTVFRGWLSPAQVLGTNTILDTWAHRYVKHDRRWLAYALATAHHETARTMTPVREWGLGARKPYGVQDPITGQAYYGRGFVQLTWKANYVRFAHLLSIDLVNRPDLALEPSTAAVILLEGMVDGLFTGAALGHFFSDLVDNPVGARRIVNGLDCADAIADTYERFLHALTPTSPPVPSVPPDPMDTGVDQT